MTTDFSNSEGLMEVEAFTSSSNICVDEILRKSDSWILHNLSTSPEVEPDNFVKNMRQALLFVHLHPDPAISFFKGQSSIKFKLINCKWIQVN